MERMIIFTTPIFKIFVLIQNPFQINKTIRFLTRNRNQFVIELKQITKKLKVGRKAAFMSNFKNSSFLSFLFIEILVIIKVPNKLVYLRLVLVKML